MAGITLKELKIDVKKMANLINIPSKKLSEVVVRDLEKTAPVDDTTASKKELIYKRTGKSAWLKDNIESRKYWKVQETQNLNGQTKTQIKNNNPAVVALALGFVELIDLGYDPVERTEDGMFSEQSPKGDYALKSIERAMKKSGYKNVTIKDK